MIDLTDVVHRLLFWGSIFVYAGSASGCNIMHRLGGNDCVCPGERIVYECSLSGAGSTVWNGTLFHCPTQYNEISLLHSRFNEVTKYCNTTNRSITVHAIRSENLCFTSQLVFSADTGVNQLTVMCVHDNEVDLRIIGSHTVIVTTDPSPPPSHLRLSKANGKELIFTWRPINHTNYCSKFYYEPLSNCSGCTLTSNSANCSTSKITSDTKVCTFAIRTVVCGNIIGTKSETVKVSLKVPEAPTINVKPEFFPNDTLKSINLTFVKVEPFAVSGDIDGSAKNYTIVYSDSTFGTMCGYVSIPASASSCDVDTCTQVEKLPTSCHSASRINISVYATNIFGDGAISLPTSITTGLHSRSKVTFGDYNLTVWILFIYIIL